VRIALATAVSRRLEFFASLTAKEAAATTAVSHSRALERLPVCVAPEVEPWLAAELPRLASLRANAATSGSADLVLRKVEPIHHRKPN
jgi:hypothetical protein